MKTILLATDFSERSDRAFRRASLLARQVGATLVVVHVVDDDQPRRILDSDREAAAGLLEDLRATVRRVDGIACETRLVLADPFAGIAQAAAESAADLLVIGPHRRQALRDVFVGTTAERTIRSVTTPVLMVNAPPVAPYAHVMLTTDLSDGAAAAARAATRLGIAGEARRSILHVVDAPVGHLVLGGNVAPEGRAAYRDDARSEAARELAAFVEATGLGTLRQSPRLSDAAPADAILEAAREEAADLVVVGTHGRSGLAKLFLGSVAEAVLRKADRDVLAVPPAAARAG